ncbi:PhoD-like phosphatase-domain-containing protein [Infundibulicybe gibba]|nr:PhoD-like phosphatase-domain-containing protein [Infundibulicybe gibba]
MRFLLPLFCLSAAQATFLLDRNLAYKSPFADHPQFSHDTGAIQKRHIQHARRQMPVEDATPFKDEHYATFYGADFSNSPFVWKGGLNFTHAVASGDPFDTSVLLWTRAVPVESDGQLPDQSVPACVSFVIHTTPTLSGKPVDSGEAFTSYDVDWTLKVEAQGLKADTKYFFQFADCTNPKSVSPIGSTRTIPSPNTPANEVNGGNPLTLAVFSCSFWQNGWFNAYGVAAHNTSADIFVHLGDYIYEPIDGAPGIAIGRPVLGRELATIHDYRQRLAQYRTDQSLVDAHLKAPWITVCTHQRSGVLPSPLTCDAIQVGDQGWKAGTADSNDSTAGCTFSPSGACFTDRKLAAVRAYHEWMPIRQVDGDDKLRIWRNFQIGKLLDLTMLDTRHYDRDITDLIYNTVVNTLANVNNRSTMGAAQEKWLADTLSESKARGAVWRIIGQQVLFSQLDLGGFINLDAWDGYRANRARLVDHLYNQEISNTVILAGDSHANWVSDLSHANDTNYDPITGHGAIGVEFAGTAVTSHSRFSDGPVPGPADDSSRQLVQINPELQWSEQFYRGFFTLTIDEKTMNATFFAMRNISFANLDHFQSAHFVVKAGESRLSRPVAGGNVTAGALKSGGGQ